jgi:hypothetical protein
MVKQATQGGPRAWAGAALALAAAVLWLTAAPTAKAAYCYYPAVGGGGHSFWTPDLGSGGFYEAALFSRTLGVYRDNFNLSWGRPQIDATDYNNPDDFGCQPENHGQEWAMTPQDIGGIKVTPKSYVDRKRALGRSYVALKNTSASPVTFDFTFDDRLGFNTATNLDRTSNNPRSSAGANDKWATVCDDPDADGCGNTAGEASRMPEVADNWEGVGKVRDSADAVTLADGDQTATITFQAVTLQPGQRAAYMEVLSLALNIRKARSEAALAGKHPGRYGVFRGLSKAEQKRLRNW